MLAALFILILSGIFDALKTKGIRFTVDFQCCESLRRHKYFNKGNPVFSHNFNPIFRYATDTNCSVPMVTTSHVKKIELS